MRILVFLTAFLAAGSLQAGALEDYVRRADPAWHWSLRHHVDSPLADAWFIDLVSQQWLDDSRVDRPLWTHELRVVRSNARACRKVPQPHTAILFIGGGDNRANPSNELTLEATLVARLFCRTVVQVKQIPNQPLLFPGESKKRREDAILAYSFDRFLRGEEADWPAHLAMVKSVVHAMDAVQELARRESGLPDIDRFVLLGSSKRGWTAWLTAAADPRVEAIIAASIDMPNLPAQMPHHFAAYGDYARALRDYKAFDIGCRLHGERGEALLDIVDPVRHLDRLAMPKFILNSAGDEFFPSDSSRFYYDRLPGEKRLRYTVNTDHRQNGTESELVLVEQGRNWIDDVLAGRKPPDLAWHVEGTGDTRTLVVSTTKKPRAVRLWTADNPDARDFRKETLGPVWVETALKRNRDGRYRATLAAPERGWRATLVEAEFGGWLGGSRQVYTTDVFVLPETMPFSSNPCGKPTSTTQQVHAPDRP